jgi:DnaK suppressor protein
MTAVTVPRAGTSHLSPAALEALRFALLDDLHAQRAQLSDLRATSDELAGHTDSDSALAREIAESGSRWALDAVAEIAHALTRIDQGTYGSCEQCDRPIPFERLEAIPQARHCMQCPPPSPMLVS